jgi:hypothetical protein
MQGRIGVPGKILKGFDKPIDRIFGRPEQPMEITSRFLKIAGGRPTGFSTHRLCLSPVTVITTRMNNEEVSLSVARFCALSVALLSRASQDR